MSAVKALQQWCRVQVQGYRDVSITNMTTSFRDGLAFCALIHKHRPDLINFDPLKKENVYENNKLAFGVAEKELGIPALLDAEDMVALQIPDRLSILTYVSQYYNYFHGRSPIGGMGGVKRPADGSAEQPSGKKNPPPVASEALPSTKPAREHSPPASANTSRPPPSPRRPRNAKQAPDERAHQTGTLSNKCVSCNKLVHLVQRHLVDGRLYHRSCAKSLALADKCPPLKDLPPNAPRAPPGRDPSETSSAAASSGPGPSWLKVKASAPPSSPGAFPAPSPLPSRPVSALSQPTTSRTTVGTASSSADTAARPTPAPRTSTTAAKTLQSKIHFFQSDPSNEVEATIAGAKKAGGERGKAQHAKAGQPVIVTVNVGKSLVEEKPSASGVGGGSGSTSQSSKAKAAAFISRKLAEENNNKPSWTKVVLKKTDKPSQVETTKAEGVRGRVKLRVDPSLLADPQNPTIKESGPVPIPKAAPSRTPDPGASKPSGASADPSAGHQSPADWRSRLKPVSKETKAPDPSANGPGRSQTSEPLGARQPSRSVAVTPPATKGSLNGQEAQTRRGAQIKISKKPGYIPKEDILKELQQIDDLLTQLEQEGVQLETRLRRCEEDGEDDSFMDELMVEWFNLIRNKQVAMRRESELVYIGKTQELEEEQPNVEQELRRLMEKPEHLKSAWHRRREEELMQKLVEIVNHRNAIVEGLDEDRLREEEEDEQLNKMMKDFNVKKEKPKKKSPTFKLFSWGSKKEAP